MSSESGLARRRFVAGCVGAAALWCLPDAQAAAATPAAAGPPRPSAVGVIIDPRIDAAAAFGAALADRGAQCHALAGDPYRFIRGWLGAGESPVIVAGMGTYADFILMTGMLREARYALVSHGLHGPSARAHRCVGEWTGCEPALRRSADRWPATLAEVVAGQMTGVPPTDRAQAPEDAGTSVVVSWVMRSRPLRRFT
jgi:hypothetical protein